jgi:hypothetical protein
MDGNVMKRTQLHVSHGSLIQLSVDSIDAAYPYAASMRAPYSLPPIPATRLPFMSGKIAIILFNYQYS